LSTISQEFVGDNTLITQIAQDNNIANVNLIFEGQQLNIRTEASAAPVAQPAPVVEQQPAVAAPAAAQLKKQHQRQPHRQPVL
jgi:hypothetical protein